MVTGAGDRLGVTGPTFMHLCHEILRSETPLDCWVVLDRRGWETLGADDGTAAAIQQLGARMEQADSICALASRLGMNEDRLMRSIEADKRTNSRKRKLGGPGAARKAVRILSSLMTWAVGEGRLERNPIIGNLRMAAKYVGRPERQLASPKARGEKLQELATIDANRHVVPPRCL